MICTFRKYFYSAIEQFCYSSYTYMSEDETSSSLYDLLEWPSASKLGGFDFSLTLSDIHLQRKDRWNSGVRTPCFSSETFCPPVNSDTILPNIRHTNRPRLNLMLFVYYEPWFMMKWKLTLRCTYSSGYRRVPKLYHSYFRKRGVLYSQENLRNCS